MAVNSVSEQVDPGSGLVSANPELWTGVGCSAALVVQDRAAEAEMLTRLAGAILRWDPTASVGIIIRAKWRKEDINAAFAQEKAFPVRRWDLAIDDPGIVALIQTTVATLPRGTSVADARPAVLDAVAPADVDARELIDNAFDTLEQGSSSTARAAVKSIRVADPNQAIGPGVHLLSAHTGKGQQTLLREAEAIASQLRANETEREELLDRRTQVCRALRVAGSSIKDLQDVLGVSRSRIQQVLREPEE
jgi:DNA helicase-2/ATP-dependent DNA helicase PcrA